MTGLDPTELVPLGGNAYPISNWTAVTDQSTLPDYVKSVLANYKTDPGLGLTSDLVKNAQVGTWDLNGQKNYGIKVDTSGLTQLPTVYDSEGNAQAARYMDKNGNLVLGNNLGDTFGIPVPFDPTTLNNITHNGAVSLSPYLTPSFAGAHINDTPTGGSAYTIDQNGNAIPTQGALQAAEATQANVNRISKVSPLVYAAPLFPIAVGLGAMALGAAGLAGGVGAGAEAGAGALGAGTAEAGGLGAGDTFLGGALTGGAGTAEAGGLGAGDTFLGGALTGGGGELGSVANPAIIAASTSAPEVGAGAAGAAGAAGTESGSTGILGTLSGIQNSITGGVSDALTGLGFSPEMASEVAPVVTKSLIGAAGNGLLSGITGGDPLKGALTGAISGGVGGIFGGATGPLAQALGVSGPVADSILGAGTGALGSIIQKQNPLAGALIGGAVGYGSSLLGNPTDTGMIGSDGNYIVPPVPPELDAAGNPIADAAGNIIPSVQPAPIAALASSNAANGGTGSSILGGKGLSGPALALGALAGGLSLMGKNNTTTTPTSSSSTATPGPASVAGNLGPYYNQNLNSSFAGRSATNPYANGVPNYWTYGGPEGQYFAGNSLRNFGYAHGGGVLSHPPQPTYDGREFSTDHGDAHVRGPGTGTSDSIAARLSDGEYVLTAKEVSDIGRGQNGQGAAKLDRLRRTGALSRMLAHA